MDVLSSRPVNLAFEFEPLPEPGTARYSLYDGSGIPLVVDQELTGSTVPILAIHNVLAPDFDFERRLVIVDWTAEGQDYSTRIPYRVIALQNHGVTPDAVRNYLAINEDELRDDEVDIFASTLQLEDLVGRERLNAALSSGTVVAIRAERAVLLQAAASLFPSLRYRIAQSRTDGTAKFERLRDAGAFSDLVSTTLAELAELVSEMVGTANADEVIPTIFLLAGRTIDPVTGVAPAAAGA